MRLAVFCAALLCFAASARAVVRQPSLEEHDTLDLEAWEARDFRVHRLAGSDLENAGFYLSLAALPAAWVAANHPGLLGFSDGKQGFFVFAYGVMPALSVAMAAGNMNYARAARYHGQREYAITHSLLPFFACAVAAGKLVALAINEGRPYRRSFPVYADPIAYTEVFFIPALRVQFSGAADYVDQVEIRVIPGGVSLGLGF